MAKKRNALAVGVLLAVAMPGLASAQDLPAAGPFRAEGTEFRPRDADYPDLVIRTSEPVKIAVVALKGNLAYSIQKVDPKGRANVTVSLSGLPANMALWRQEDGKRHEEPVTTSPSGELEDSLSLAKPHLITWGLTRNTEYITGDKVLSGTIFDEVVILVDGATVIGEDNCTIDRSGSTNGTGILIASHTGTTIRNIKVVNAGIGVWADHSSSTTLEDVTIENCSEWGFYSYSGKGATLTRVSSRNNVSGIGLYDENLIPGDTYSTVANCTFADRHGVLTSLSRNITVADSVFRDGPLNMSPKYGIYMHNSPGSVVRNNDLAYSQMPYFRGIVVGGEQEASNYEIIGNQISGVEGGIWLYTAAPVTVRDNTISAVASGNDILLDLPDTTGITIYRNNFLGPAVTKARAVAGLPLPIYLDNGAEGNFWDRAASGPPYFVEGVDSTVGLIDRFPFASKSAWLDATPPPIPAAPDLIPACDTGLSDTDNITANTTPTFMGTAEAGSTVKLYAGTDLVGEAVAVSGSYAVTASALAEGTYAFTVTPTDAAGNVSQPSPALVVTIDVTPPAVPSAPDLDAASDTGVSSTDNITSDTTPTFTGTADANATVQLFYGGAIPIGTTSADAAGFFTLAVSETELPEGTLSITAKAADVAGNVSAASAEFPVIVDKTAPAAPSTPDLDAGSDTGASNSDNITSNRTPTFNGTADPDAAVTLYAGADPVAGAVADGAEPYSLTSSELGAGVYEFTALAVDLAGNVSPRSNALQVTIDASAPATGTIIDGAGANDIDVQASLAAISASWSGFSDPQSGIAGYEWAIGTDPLTEAGRTNVQPFVDVGPATSASASLDLVDGTTYFVTVRVTNGAGLASIATSDGVRALLPASGIYTVGAGKIYATPTAAATDLAARGQSGPVVFDVYAGTYLDPLALGAVPGNSAANTITFRKAADAGGVVNLGPVQIAGASYLTLQDFDSITGATGSRAVSIGGTSTNVSLVHDRINAGGEGAVGVYVGPNGGHNNISVSRCEIVGTGNAYYAIQIDDNDNPSANTTGFSLTNNMIRGFVLRAIDLWSNFGGYSGVAYHNTVWITATGNCYAVAQRGMGGLVWRNNIFANYSPSGGSTCFSHTAGTLDSDYNDFYRPNGAATGFINGDLRATIADWRAASGGQDANSIQADPRFAGDADLHIQVDSPCQEAGLPSLVAIDFDSEPRAAAPDIGADENLNSVQPLHGTITVGPGKSYATPAAAAEDLTARGQSGPVTFDVYAGSYADALLIGAVPGNSSANPIIFRKAPDAGGAVGLGRIQIIGASFVTLRDFDSVSATGAHAISIGGTSTNISIVRTRIAVAGNGGGPVVGDGFAAIFIDGGGHNSILVDSCNLVGSASAAYGIKLANATTNTEGWKVTNNFIRGFLVAGVHLSNVGTGAHVYRTAIGQAYHNTIRIDGGSGSRCVYQNNVWLKWRNNIFANYSAAADSTCFDLVSGTIDSDYNLFWYPNGAKAGLKGAIPCTNLADWQAATRADTNSIARDPLFVAADDLHIQNESYCQGAALAGLLPTDFDGEPRDAATPDIGADENLAPDPNPPMTGTYTVGAGRTYASPSAAFDDLVVRGLAGPVTFDVYSGDYLAPLITSPIRGGTSTNKTVTFRKAPGESGLVNLGALIIRNIGYVGFSGFDSISASGTPAVTIASSRHISLECNTVSATGANAIALTGLSPNVSLVQNTVSVSGDGIAAVCVEGSGKDNLTLSGCRLTGSSGADFGLSFFNGSDQTKTLGWTVINNTILGFDRAGISINSSRVDPGSQSFFGVSGVAYHNTICLNTGTVASACVYYSNLGATIVWRNNILANLSTSAAASCFDYLFQPEGVLDSDFNDLHRPNGAAAGRQGGIVRPTILDWQTNTGLDWNSIGADPLFVSSSDLHIQAASYCQGMALGGLGVTVDADGDARSATAADIGADENLAPDPNPPLSGVYSVGQAKNFPNILSAVEAMVNRGLSGTVAFEIYSDYTQPINLVPIRGSSAANRITFRKAAIGRAVTLGPIKFHRLSHVSIEGLNLQSAGVTAISLETASTDVSLMGNTISATRGRAVSIGGAASYVSMAENNISASEADGVFIGGASTDISLIHNTISVLGLEDIAAVHSDGSNNHRLTISRCNLIGMAGAGYGIVHMSHESVPTNGWRIDDNFIQGFTRVGIRLTMNSLSGPGVNGIACFNTVRVASGSMAGHCVIFSNRDASFLWRDNIFANLNTTASSCCFKILEGTVNSNFNDFYRPKGASTGSSASVSLSTLADWRSATGQDANSIQADPLWAPDLRLTVGSPCVDSGGIDFTGSFLDYDGGFRPYGIADIGADELRPPPLSGTLDVGKGRTYPAPADAADDLVRRGQSGPVIVSILPGSYPGFSLGPVPGNSLANSITFEPNSGGVSLTSSVTLESVYGATVRNISISSAGRDAVSLKNQSSNVNLYNLSINVSGDHTSAVSVVGSHENLTVERCRLTGFSGSDIGLTFWVPAASPVPGLFLANNTVRGFDTVGIYLGSFSASQGLSGEIYHNTVRMDVQQGTCAWQTHGSIAWRNNIFAHYGGGAAECFRFVGIAPDTDYGDFYRANGAATVRGGATYADAITYATLPDWQAASGKDAHSIQEDPLFAGATDFHLLLTSRCIDMGTSLTRPTEDFDGDPRASGSALDIGADEFDYRSVPPPTVNDGDGAQDQDSQPSLTTISANWTSFDNFGPGRGVVEYFWAIGTEAGKQDVLPFTSVGAAMSAKVTGLWLTVNRWYFVTVKATYVRPNSFYAVSSDGILTVAAPPEAPTSFEGTGTSTMKIRWSWTAMPGASSYEIHDEADRQVGASRDPFFEERNLNENTQYTRHVHAGNVLGTSDASPSGSRYTLVHNAGLDDFTVEACVTRPLVTVLPPPSNPLGQTGVLVERWTDGQADWEMVRDFEATWVFHEPVPVAPGPWSYRITFRNGDGIEGPASTAQVVTTVMQPAAPTGLRAVGGSGSITLSWNAGVENCLAGYNVYRSEASGGPYSRRNADPVAAPTYADAADANTRYYYVVMAVSICSVESPPSNEASATASDPNAPPPPTNLTVLALSGANHLRWDPVEGAVGYRVYRQSLVDPNQWDPLTPGKLVDPQFGTEYRDNYRVDGLPDAVYTYRVTAVK